MHRHRKMPVQLSIPLKDDAKYFSRSRTEIKPSLSGSIQRARNWPLHSKSNVKLEVGLKPAAISLPILLHYLAAAQLDSIAVVLFIISLGRSVILSELSLDRRLEGDTNRPNYQTNRISKDVRVRPVRSIRERENELI